MRIAIDTDHAVAQIRQASGGYTAYVTQADNRNLGVILIFPGRLHVRLL